MAVLAPLLFIVFLIHLQLLNERTCIKAFMSLNFDQIPPLTMNLAALERLKINVSTFCIYENKGADQLRSNLAADQRLCFYYIVQSLYFIKAQL